MRHQVGVAEELYFLCLQNKVLRCCRAFSTVVAIEVKIPIIRVLVNMWILIHSKKTASIAVDLLVLIRSKGHFNKVLRVLIKILVCHGDLVISKHFQIRIGSNVIENNWF